MSGEDVTVTATGARCALERACDDLDAAVGSLPHSADQDVLANPTLIALLLRVVVARCQLAEVDCCVVPVTGAWVDRKRWVDG